MNFDLMGYNFLGATAEETTIRVGMKAWFCLTKLLLPDEECDTLPTETIPVMVECQSLALSHAFAPGRDGRTTVVNKLVGDPLEKAVLEACKWTLLPGGKDTVVKMNTQPPESIRILHRFAFSSTLRRMSVLAIDNDAPGTGNSCTLWALTKGSPETIMPWGENSEKM